MLCARRRQFVDPNAAVCRRDAPFSLHELFPEQALESRIQRAFFDLKQVIRGSFDLLDERVAVHGLPFQHPENHHLQSTRKEISLCWIFHTSGFFS